MGRCPVKLKRLLRLRRVRRESHGHGMRRTALYGTHRRVKDGKQQQALFKFGLVVEAKAHYYVFYSYFYLDKWNRSKACRLLVNIFLFSISSIIFFMTDPSIDNIGCLVAAVILQQSVTKRSDECRMRLDMRLTSVLLPQVTSPAQPVGTK